MTLSRPLLAAIALVSFTLPALAQETREFTDDLGRTQQIPTAPQRIVSLHDLIVTVPMLELGMRPVGSFARIGTDEHHFIRGAKTLTGVDFSNSEIVSIGAWPADVEAVSALNPDLIIRPSIDTTPLDQLEKIAPVVTLEDNMRGDFTTFESIATITGTQKQLDVLRRRYAGQIDQLRALIDTSAIKVAVIGPQDGQIVVWHTYGALGKVLRDAGFQAPPIIDAIEGSDRVFFSAEQLQEFDADFIFTTADLNSGETPADVIAGFEKVMPGFCDFLHACRNGQFIVLPREDSVTRSYYALGLMASAVTSAIAGSPFISLEETP